MDVQRDLTLTDYFIKLLMSINSLAFNSKNTFLVNRTHNYLNYFLKYFISYTKDRTNINLLRLDSQVVSILDIFQIFFHGNNGVLVELLELERDVLVFRKLILSLKQVNTKKEKIVTVNRRYDNSNKTKADSINPTKDKIVSFINKEGEALNLDVFSHFNDISKRTLKRHLSELISEGHIHRESQGKKVYYKKPQVTSQKMTDDANQ